MNDTKTLPFLITKIIFLIFVVLLLANSTNIAFAQDGNPTDDQVNAIAKDLYCPVCENVPLDVCPTQACAQWRALIKEKLTDGWSEQQIKQYFVDQYGDRVLAQPPARGLNLMVYILPPLFFLGGIVVLYKNLKKTKISSEKIIQESKIDENEKYLKEIEDALQNLDKRDN
jgi:cytochrome c-type biogenesis protein CcmH